MLKLLTLQGASSLLREVFPSLQVETIEEMSRPGEIEDGNVFLVNGDTVFQVPTSEDAAGHLKTQLRLFPMLASSLPLPIPHYCGSAFSPTGLPICACYPLIPGRPLLPRQFTALASDTQKTSLLARQIGEFLTSLHSFPVQKAVSCGLAEPCYPLIEQIVRQNASVRSNLYPHLDVDEREFINTTFKGLLWELRDYDPAPALCHGRLLSERLLLAQGGDGLAGVIGWGGMTLGDPAIDFTWRAEYGENFFFQVLEHYRCPLPEPEQFVRVVACHCRLLPVEQMMIALKTQDREGFEQARRSLTREPAP